jgi:hypothetical protein
VITTNSISVVICDLDIPYLVNPVIVATYAYVFITIDSSLNQIKIQETSNLDYIEVCNPLSVVITVRTFSQTKFGRHDMADKFLKLTMNTNN